MSRTAVFDNTRPDQYPSEIVATKEMSDFLDALDDHNAEVAGEIVGATIHLTGHIGVPQTLLYLDSVVAALKGGMVDTVAEANEVPTSKQIAGKLN